MSIEDNKRVAERFIEGVRHLDSDEIAEVLTDDFTFWLPGSLEISGSHSKNDFLRFPRLLRNLGTEPLEYDILNITAEGDRVCYEARGRLPLKNGTVYQNVYLLLLTIRDGKVSSAKEYSDTDHVRTILIPAMHGAATV